MVWGTEDDPRNIDIDIPLEIDLIKLRNRPIRVYRNKLYRQILTDLNIRMLFA